MSLSGNLSPQLPERPEEGHSDEISGEPIPPLEHLGDDLELPESDPELVVASGDSDTAAEILSDGPISLTEVVESGEPTLDIHNRIRGRISEDPLFKQITDDPTKFKNFEVSNELVFHKERRLLCIPDVKIGVR